MRYLVMEVHPGHCVVLDEKGSFYRVANLDMRQEISSETWCSWKTSRRKKRRESEG